MNFPNVSLHVCMAYRNPELNSNLEVMQQSGFMPLRQIGGQIT
jgi:hypothetical protein